jgi:hypothetical protein
MIKALPLGAPTAASLIAVEDGAQGRMRMDGIKLALFVAASGQHWEVISGTPPTWFARVWNRTPFNGEQLAAEFKHAKLYVKRTWDQNEQRDWIHLRI